MPPKTSKPIKSLTEVVAPTIIVHTLMPQNAPVNSSEINSDSDDDGEEFVSDMPYLMQKQDNTTRPVGEGGEYSESMLTKDDINRQIAILDGLVSRLEEPLPVASTKRANKMIRNNHKFTLNQHIAVREYFKMRNQGIKKMEASIMVAKDVFGKDTKHSFKAKCIREWADHYIATGSFKQQRQGKHPKTKTVILKKEVQDLLRSRVLMVNEIDRTPAAFMNLLNNSLLAEIPEAPAKVSKETARRWLNIIGFHSSNSDAGNYLPPNANLLGDYGSHV